MSPTDPLARQLHLPDKFFEWRTSGKRAKAVDAFGGDDGRVQGGDDACVLSFVYVRL